MTAVQLPVVVRLTPAPALRMERMTECLWPTEMALTQLLPGGAVRLSSTGGRRSEPSCRQLPYLR
jgi:hypothetical protein